MTDRWNHGVDKTGEFPGTGTNRMDIHAGEISAAGRLGFAVALARGRIAALDEQADELGLPRAGARFGGPAYEVHIWGDFPALLRNEQTLTYLEQLAEMGGRSGVVTLVHDTVVDTVQACVEVSRRLSTAIMAGRHFRVAETRG